MNTLEETSNSSFVQLEVRVSDLEETDIDHGTRLTIAENDINSKFLS